MTAAAPPPEPAAAEPATAPPAGDPALMYGQAEESAQPAPAPAPAPAVVEGHPAPGVPAQPVIMAAGAPANLPMVWPNHPMHVVCPACQVEVLTNVTHINGVGTWAICGGICLVGGCFGCCLIPFCVDTCKDASHSCSECNRFLGMHKIIS